MSSTENSMEPADIRPIVATGSQSNLGLYVFFAILLVGGFGLFSALNANRQQARIPQLTIPDESGARIVSPPPLRLPASLLESEQDQLPQSSADNANARIQPFAPAPVVLQQAPSRAQPFAPEPNADVPPAFLEPSGPRVVFEQPSQTLPAINPAPATPSAERVEAARLANPSMTVPQGTVIPAVLETALDSTRPGGVRALVQRDIFGFDGTRLLIHRGSRLYGTYEAGLNPGERRALIRWTRLIRPDGVTIALDSPASDPLGRAGVAGDVKSRFFARFGGAILQSVLDIGVGIATREATDGVIVALPGSTQNVSAATQPQQVQPVLRVEHGTSVSVFVARDLDFSSVER